MRLLHPMSAVGQNNLYFVITRNEAITGVTNNLVRRIYEHKEKIIKGFSSKYNLSKLVYFENTNDIKEAIKREKQLKAVRERRK